MEKDYSDFRCVAHIRIPKDALECQKFLSEHHLTLAKQTNRRTGTRNFKLVPEIYDTLRHESGLIVKVRDYEYIPFDNKWYWIIVTNNNPNTDKEIFQMYFHDYTDAEEAERASLIKTKRGRKPLPDPKIHITITRIKMW